MTQPLKYASGFNLQRMTAGEFALFRYNLRTRYAAQMLAGGAGAIVIGGGSNFGSAVNTERTQVSASTAGPPYPNPSTGTTPRQSYAYGQNLAAIPANPTNFTNSYVRATATDIIREGDVSRILDFVVNPCIEEMRNGDEVGTYRVQIPSPGPGWMDMGIFFRDSIYLNGGAVSYPLWLRLSSPTPPAGPLPMPLRAVAAGLQRQVTIPHSPFDNLIYDMLVNRLNSGALRYNAGTTQVGINRGTFLDTRFSTTDRAEQQFGADDYRTTVTPEGPATTFTNYFLGLA